LLVLKLTGILRAMALSTARMRAAALDSGELV
jgi:hypothetical protein